MENRNVRWIFFFLRERDQREISLIDLHGDIYSSVLKFVFNCLCSRRYIDLEIVNYVQIRNWIRICSETNFNGYFIGAW